jgi:hypothetical protein
MQGRKCFGSLISTGQRVFPETGSPTRSGRRPSAGRIKFRAKASVLIMVLTTVFVGGPALADSIDERYTVPFVRHAPTNVDEALSSFAARARPVVAYLACGLDIDLYHWMVEQTNPGNFDEQYENVTAVLIGKMAWLAGLPDEKGARTLPEFGVQPCAQNIVLKHRDFKDHEDLWTAIKDRKGESELNQKLSALFSNPTDKHESSDCGRWVFYDSDQPDPDQINATSNVERQCIQLQINSLLRKIIVIGKLGSSGLPCYGDFENKTHGEWDVKIRNLLRILYLNNRYTWKPPGSGGTEFPERQILSDPTVEYVRDRLINLEAQLGQVSYSPLDQCGNVESGEGSPEERRDEHSWVTDAEDDVGNLLYPLERLFHLIFALLSLPLDAVTGDWQQLKGDLEKVLVNSGGVIFPFWPVPQDVRIPETENHRFMIESSRFLRNQLDIVYFKTKGESTDGLEDLQRDVRNWLLDRMQKVLEQDFDEYNARPYGRYSLNAILNLADFSEDKEVRTAANLVLHYTMAKFFVGASQGRRLVPFRRLQGVVFDKVLSDASFFEQCGGADHAVALGLMLSGQTQQLPQQRSGSTVLGASSVPGALGVLPLRMISNCAPLEMIYSATSSYRPSPAILSLALSDDPPILQRIRHGGYEIYSRSAVGLITAGGTQTDAANKATAVGLGLPFLRVHVGGRDNDRGAGVPTTFMPKDVFSKKSEDQTKNHLPADPKFRPSDFLRIEGQQEIQISDRIASYLDNLCVWRNFACGRNLQIPKDMRDCIDAGPKSSDTSWLFFDSSACEPYKGASPKFYIAIRRAGCKPGDPSIVPNFPDRDPKCFDNHGFFEVVPVRPRPFDLAFDDFRKEVIHDNPPEAFASDTRGVYRTARDAAGDKHIISWDAKAHENDSQASGIVSVDNIATPKLDDWPLADGDVIRSTGDGRVIITGATLFTIPPSRPTVELDMTDSQHPSFKSSR